MSEKSARGLRRRSADRIGAWRGRQVRALLRWRYLQYRGLSGPRRHRCRFCYRAWRRSLFRQHRGARRRRGRFLEAHACACPAGCRAYAWSKTARPANAAFRYWREGAPARELFELPDWMRVAEGLMSARLIYFSGITLSLYSNNGLGRFLALLEAARQQGAKVAFDGNFRPRGWKGDLRARAPCSSKRSSASISRCRPSMTKRCCGAIPVPEATVARLQAFGIGEIVGQERSQQRAGRHGRRAGIRAGTGSHGAGRCDGGRRRLQCRLSGGAAFRQRSGASGERRASAGRRRHPPSRRARSARRCRDALSAE